MSNEKRHRVSRRQFLTYTLTGVGGFMAAGMLSPMVRMALDPALEAGADSEFVSIGISEDELTDEPQRVDFQMELEDGWYTSEQARSAWIYKEGDEIIALSPTCTHLGCTVNWDSNENFPEQFYCPCHDGRFERDGTNIEGTPPTRPLDIYDVEVRDGAIYLGQINQRS
ncbi:ubiquinol-cytochrome c reductase iron-sulfur subunit [Salipaludibacillus aurantiacus]|uniref:Menaquinol:cytochrome c reductase iron-sulfur subunit n=1 Tax=Salipaludibacillus aurantiacus TaxID=1601833 RepID=A0A1H9P8I6_9BACI|nr:ubiquinol-cytochrome c reductase iron-sulfur subunit [Salipaludibacillus aurantiacus]SER43913.1 menaquinol-cytochrome c reductase iron-sulfur subunit [Salipaludibacillus aurantiacus]